MMRFWTSDEDARLREMLERGESYATIAAALHRTEKSISGRVYSSGYARRDERPWKSEDVEKLIHMRLAGQSMPRIAAELNRTENAVAIKLVYLRRSL